MNLLPAARGLLPVRQTLRIGVTGLARAGKTVFLTSLAANLLAGGQGLPPAARTRATIRLAPAGADDLPRFDYRAHVAALAADPPHWPARTDATALLALDIDIVRTGLTAALPPRRLRLELLDYPGEWLLDLPLLTLDFPAWSQRVLARLDREPAAAAFLTFLRGLPASAPADDSLATAGHHLYRALLHTLRDRGLSLLQPGRFLMPRPGAEPPWIAFFPMPGSSPLARLLQERYAAYVQAVRRDLAAPSFGKVHRLVVLADLLSALHTGAHAFADAAAALDAVAKALRWQQPTKYLPNWLTPLFGGIDRVAFAVTKSDHIAERQRGNLAALIRCLTQTPGDAATKSFALASIRCTEDFVWTLDDDQGRGRPVSAVRGRVENQGLVGSYPGEVPDTPPGPDFWAHPFLAIPDFQPPRLPLGARGGIPQINLDALLAFLLEDYL